MDACTPCRPSTGSRQPAASRQARRPAASDPLANRRPTADRPPANRQPQRSMGVSAFNDGLRATLLSAARRSFAGAQSLPQSAVRDGPKQLFLTGNVLAGLQYVSRRFFEAQVRRCGCVGAWWCGFWGLKGEPCPENLALTCTGLTRGPPDADKFLPHALHTALPSKPHPCVRPHPTRALLTILRKGQHHPPALPHTCVPVPPILPHAGDAQDCEAGHGQGSKGAFVRRLLVRRPPGGTVVIPVLRFCMECQQ
eukprot:362011-Chlamydomonas_euryale.AAC.11